MRKRFATKAKYGKSKYYQKRIDEEYFKGYACYLKMDNVEKPLIVNDGTGEICILDNNYKWLELYPDNEKYAITVMYNDKDNLIEWYFDVAKETGIENGIPFEDDLYLDVVIMPNGEIIVIDQDELQEALDKKEITTDDFYFAYEIANKIKDKYKNNIDELADLTDNIHNKITKEIENIKEREREF